MTTESGQVPAAVTRLWDRRAVFLPFALAGLTAVLAGGIVAAVIAAPAPTRHGTWAAAYLVLVLGLSQLALGAGQALLAAAAPSARHTAVTAALFNVANLGVIAGVLSDRVAVLDAGSALLFVALGFFLYGVRRSDGPRLPLLAYRGVLIVLAVSIPIGLLVTTVAR